VVREDAESNGPVEWATNTGKRSGKTRAASASRTTEEHHRAKLKDWVADFALAGQAALEGPEQASRMVMFHLYYLGLTPYDRARHFLGLSERSWVNWSEELRAKCGKELLRRGMFPPRKYYRTGE
jgi:hypothetical protein